MTDLAQLQADHDEKAAAIGVFESEYAVADAEWKARRIAVNTAYRDADAALQAEQNKATTLVVEASTRAAVAALATAQENATPIGEAIDSMVAAAYAAAKEVAGDMPEELLDARARSAALGCFTGVAAKTIQPEGVVGSADAGAETEVG